MTKRTLLWSLLICAVFIFSACSPRVLIHSNPDGAGVWTNDGVLVGETPLILEGDKLESLEQSGRLNLILKYPKYFPRQIVWDIHYRDEHTVELTPVSGESFAEVVLKYYSKELNEITRELLKIQGLVIARKLNEAEERLIEFQNIYPNLVPSFVLRANIFMMKGQTKEAEQHLLRARTLDPNDAVVQRMLALLNQGQQGG